MRGESEDELENGNYNNQADQEDDTNGAAKEFQHRVHSHIKGLND